MKQKFYFLLTFAIFFTQLSFAQQDSIDVVMEDSTASQIDKTIASEEKKLIDDVIDNKKSSADRQKNVQYLSTLTQYGFKNLFNNTTYTPTQPYSSQVNPHAEAYMNNYINRFGRGLQNMRSWAGPYFNLIDNVFSQYGLPKELKYLAVIESHLDASTTSWVGAAGPWQFMPYTAREYGLAVNGAYDERRDFYKSTHAAAKYLLVLYRQMHDWLLVIAAYNGGPGRVYSAIRKSGSRNFWDLQYNLPEESRNHVKKFIATHYIMEGSSGNFGMPGAVPSDVQLSFDMPSMSVQYKSGNYASYNNSAPSLSSAESANALKQIVTGKFKSLIIAKNLTMDIATFNRFNPKFDQQLQANGQYEMILPEDKMQLFVANKFQILNECVQMMYKDDDVPQNKTVYPKKYQRKPNLKSKS